MTVPRDRQSYLQGRIDAFEEAAEWHDREADDAMNSLHCGSQNHEYREAHRLANWHRLDAEEMRRLATAARADLAAATDKPEEGQT